MSNDKELNEWLAQCEETAAELDAFERIKARDAERVRASAERGMQLLESGHVNGIGAALAQRTEGAPIEPGAMDLDDMRYATEAEAVACAQSMIEAARDARAIVSYRVYNVGGAKPYRITSGALPRPVRLVAWFMTDGQTAKRMLVGR